MRIKMRKSWAGAANLALSVGAVSALSIPATAMAQRAPANLLPQNAAPVIVAEVPVDESASEPTIAGEATTPAPVYRPVPAARSIPARTAPVAMQAKAVVQKLNPDIPDWSTRNAAALIEVVENIGKEGLDPADYQIEDVRAALAAGPSEKLNNAANRTMGWLIEDLRDGRTPMSARKQWFVVDPDRDNLPTNRLIAQALNKGNIAGIVKQLTPTNPDYAKLKAELAKTPKTDTKKRKLIRANMDRWRWLRYDLGDQYLLTNVPEYQLRLVVRSKEDGKYNIVRTYRTIVGKPGRTATPQLAEEVEGVIFNPTWTVPQSIVKGEGLGAKVLNNPEWAKRAGYKATKGANGYVSVVQQPGPTNSLGLMKLDMPNRHAIFLHDTPSRGLFKNSDRALSHGCVRTERASELGMTLAILQAKLPAQKSAEILKSGKYTRVGFDDKMPVYITYFTMGTDIDGKMRAYKDIYGRDEPVLASLDQPRQSNRTNVTDEEIVEIVDDLQ